MNKSLDLSTVASSGLNNPRLSHKEKGLLKGAIRRVFSRSEIRRKALKDSSIPGHSDPNSPRVRAWSRCCICFGIFPSYKMDIDHKFPVVPVDQTLETMTADQLIDRIWCDEEFLRALCKECHKQKTKEENSERRKFKKLRSE